MLFGDECLVRPEGVEIDHKELQPLGVGDGSVIWGIAREQHAHAKGTDGVGEPVVHYILSPIPPQAWGSSFRMSVRLWDRRGTVHQLTELLAELGLNIIAHESTPAGFRHCMANLICEYPSAFRKSLETIREEAIDVRRQYLNEKQKLDGSHGATPEGKESITKLELRLHRLRAIAAAKSYLRGTTTALHVRLVGAALDPAILAIIRDKLKGAGEVRTLKEQGGLIELNGIDSHLSTIDVKKRMDFLSRDGHLANCVSDLMTIVEPARSVTNNQGVAEHITELIRGMIQKEETDRRGFLDIRFLFAQGVYVELRSPWEDAKYRDEVNRKTTLKDEELFLSEVWSSGPWKSGKNMDAIEALQSRYNAYYGKPEGAIEAEMLWDSAGREWCRHLMKAVELWVSPVLMTCWLENDPEKNCAVFTYDASRGFLELTKDPWAHSHRGFWDKTLCEYKSFIATASITWREAYMRLTPLPVQNDGDHWCRIIIRYRARMIDGYPIIGVMKQITAVLLEQQVNLVRVDSSLTGRPVPSDAARGCEEVTVTIIGKSLSRKVNVRDVEEKLKEVAETVQRELSQASGGRIGRVFDKWDVNVIDGQIRRLFVSTRFETPLWLSAGIRGAVTTECQNKGFQPQIVDASTSSDQVIAQQCFETIKRSDCMLSLLSLKHGESLQEASLEWVLAEYVFARAHGLPVAIVVDLRGGTLTINDWINRLKIIEGMFVFGFSSDHDLIHRVLPKVLTSLKAQLRKNGLSGV